MKRLIAIPIPQAFAFLCAVAVMSIHNAELRYRPLFCSSSHVSDMFFFA